MVSGKVYKGYFNTLHSYIKKISRVKVISTGSTIDKQLDIITVTIIMKENI